jgi:phosphoribosylanthranilate isomerase
LVSKVGVFADATEPAVHQIADQCDLDLLQFHGQETPEFCSLFGARAVKAFRIQDESSLEGLRRYQTTAWLLDSFVPGQLGGSGQVFNWELARRATELGRPVILAGGLTPLNVGQAVRQVRPYAVDVSSGVEAAPGRKDAKKVRDFVTAAKGVDFNPASDSISQRMH